GLRTDVVRSVETAESIADLRSLPALVRSALELDQVERHWLHPEAVFSLARSGAAVEAERRLALFPSEEYWREAGSLLIAWLLAKLRPDDARAIVQRFPDGWPGRPPLPLLQARVRATLGDGPRPALT